MMGVKFVLLSGIDAEAFLDTDESYTLHFLRSYFLFYTSIAGSHK